MFRHILAFSGLLFNALILGTVTLALLVSLLFSYYGTNLPSAEQIENYRPATLSRVYDEKGNILGVFGQKNRIYTPINDIPALIKNAFISAEDKNFFQHPGYDLVGLLKAITDAFRGKKLRGASTITQQVMKNFLLSGERTGKRKIKEIMLASRIEKVLSKEEILNVYLNEIYLGQGAYGVTAAAITYFDKKLGELTIAEAAFLAALPKAPSFYHPIRQRVRSIERRNFVIRELKENGFISATIAEQNIKTDLVTILSVNKAEKALTLLKESSYFNDAIKKAILRKYDSEVLETDGLTIRSTLKPDLQYFAKKALQDHLISYDESLKKYRGPVGKIPAELLGSVELIQSSLATQKIYVPVDDWLFAIVNKVFKSYAEILLVRENKTFETAQLDFNKGNLFQRRLLENAKIIDIIDMRDILNTGDIVFVSSENNNKIKAKAWSLRQLPEVQGAFMVMEPNSGKVLAMQGGFSHAVSKFNRALQAKRQPGSLFKPFVYLTALENGFHPNSIIVDAPLSIKQVNGIWRPSNATNSWFGVAPLRKGLEYSRNLMTVRLAKVVGMNEVKKYAELFGLYDNMPPLLSYSLGAGETTLFKLVVAYSILANGGLEVEPSFFDLVQDRYGRTIYQHGHLKCLGCRVSENDVVRKPIFLNMAKRLVDPVSIFQLNSMLQGVVDRGTASRTVGKLGLSIAGKTGTTNESKDVWFVGYTPNLVAGCYIGYDMPRTLGSNATGGSLCGSVFKTFIESAYGNKLIENWAPPAGTKFVDIDYNTGRAEKAKRTGTIKELFRENEDPFKFHISQAIDGGLGMGQDLLLFNEPLKNIELNGLDNKKSIGAITIGDQY